MRAVIFSLLFVSLVLISCAKRDNYADKVGVYTYNEAISELGPADLCEQVNQNKVCSWTTGVNKNWVDKIILTFDGKDVLLSGKEKRF